MYRHAALLLLFSTLSFSGSASQTDWSGGPGTPGPVPGWASSFATETAADWWSAPGLVLLAPDRSIDVGSGCCQVRTADIDGDGDLDVAASGNWDDEVVWYENEGSGTAWTHHTIASYELPEGLTVGDFDSDGDCDVAAVSAGGTIDWFENSGTGAGWTAHGIDYFWGSVRTLDAGDVDGDGDIDILGCIEYNDDVVWWRNNGGASGWTRMTVDSYFDGAWASILADIDGDGDLDIAATRRDYTDGEIHWWENSGGSGSAWNEHVVDSYYRDPRSITAGDVDGDGDLDLASTSFYDDQLTWWANTGGIGGFMG